MNAVLMYSIAAQLHICLFDGGLHSCLACVQKIISPIDAEMKALYGLLLDDWPTVVRASPLQPRISSHQCLPMLYTLSKTPTQFPDYVAGRTREMVNNF